MCMYLCAYLYYGRLADLLKYHKDEIMSQQIVAPIIIAGLPRSGTTHLLHLLESSDMFRTVKYYEAIEPIIAASAQSQISAVLLFFTAKKYYRAYSTFDCGESFLYTALQYGIFFRSI